MTGYPKQNHTKSYKIIFHLEEQQVVISRDPFQEAREIGYFVERYHGGWWQIFCKLCNKFVDQEHLESAQHLENKQKPWQLLALSTPQDEAFLVSLQVSGSEPGLSLQKTGAHLKVQHLEDDSLLAHWNENVSSHQLPWAVDQPRVEVGHRVLEVEGLVGDQAVAVAQRACHKLRMTVALPREEEGDDEQPGREAMEPVPLAQRPLSPPSAASASSAPSLPGGPGCLWEALWPNIKGRKGEGTDSVEVCLLSRGHVVVQVADCVRLSNGLVRMPVRSFVRDYNEIWVTLDARDAGSEGKLFFQQFDPLGREGTLWQVSPDMRVIVRNRPALDSDYCDQIPSGAVVTQAFECQRVEECLRMPIKLDQKIGWVTLDARAKGGPLFFQFLAPLQGGIWRALADAMPFEACLPESRAVGPVVPRGEIVVQNGPCRKVDGQVWFPISGNQGTAWVLLSEGRVPEVRFELVAILN